MESPFKYFHLALMLLLQSHIALLLFAACTDSIQRLGDTIKPAGYMLPF